MSQAGSAKPQPIHEQDENLDTESQQFLTFQAGGEEYGVDILAVQGIRGWEGTTPIPNTPDYVKGVINLRGSIIPIIDLRIRFGLQESAYSSTNVVIVLRVESEGRERTMGIVVDSVSDVHTVALKDIHPPPELGEKQTDKFLCGVATVDDMVVILLDTDKLLDLQELVDVDVREDRQD